MTFDRTLLQGSALEVAPLLLGARFTRGGISLRVTEVEAYLGDTDPGSHAFRGQTPRTVPMFGPPGHLYAYFTYGMHVCANVVCSPNGEASAVLLRAGEITSGLPEARMRRPTSRVDADLARGPARLTKAVGIELSDSGADLAADPFTLTLADQPLPFQSGPRTGVSGAGGSTAYPWRFWLPGEVSVSPYRPSAPMRTKT
ncbi:MAG: DNA-3-methyladenine glycosylase [Cryobacterium sp.]